MEHNHKKDNYIDKIYHWIKRNCSEKFLKSRLPKCPMSGF